VNQTQTVAVYDVTADRVIEVTVAEAAAGMVRYARSLGAGTPACGVYERRALEIRETIRQALADWDAATPAQREAALAAAAR
jgi:hypothetical protein